MQFFIVKLKKYNKICKTIKNILYFFTKKKILKNYKKFENLKK